MPPGKPDRAPPQIGVLFQAYVDQVLAPKLRPSDVAVMDNLGSRKAPAVAAAIQDRGPDTIST